MGSIILIIFYLLFPYLIIRLTEKYSLLKKIGSVVLAFITGLILSFTGILPDSAAEIQDIFMSATVILALPMLLFGSDVRSWKRIAGKTLISMLSGVASLIIIVSVGYIIWKDDIANAQKVGGMMIGLYTGGTPNLAALKTALNVEPELYLMVNTYDLFFGMIFLLSIMSFGKVLLSYIMKPFTLISNNYNSQIEVNIEDIDENPFKKTEAWNLIKTLGLAILISGIGAGISFAITGGISMLVLVLTLTTLSLLAGTLKQVKQLKSSFNFGMYFILIFSLVLASMVRLELLANISYNLFFYIGFTIFGTLFLHILLSIIFRIDRDTTLITATTLICSPPFVPMIAASLKNKNIILPGITVGIIGYAVGNYLGVLVAWMLNSWLG
ncbi:MAG: DUF819 family protein [Bacteroidales bacterium]|nr:DUF819 family protein [Bacteroidales bacterium]